jgi:GAF domain-containing protein
MHRRLGGLRRINSDDRGGTVAEWTTDSQTGRGGGRLPPQTLEALVTAQADIARHLELDALASAVVDAVQGLLGATHVTLGLVEAGVIVYRAATGPQVPSVRLPRLSLDGQSLSALAIRKGQLLRSDDTRVDPRVDQAAVRQLGALSMLAAPLSGEPGRFGVLNAFSASPNAFTPERVRVMELIAPFAGDAVLRAFRFGAHAAR